MRPERRPAFAVLAAIAAIAIGLASALAGPPAQAAASFDLAQLTALLAQVRAGTATFVEHREVALLERTQESSGRLTFAAPDTFVRETLKPRRDRIAVVGNTVTMSQGSRSRTVQLDASPEAAVIVEAIRGTLTGNREALERHFQTAVTGAADRWALELVPRDFRLREQVSSVQVRGERALVREVVVRLADGDRSTMTIEPETAGTAPPSRAPARGASLPP